MQRKDNNGKHQKLLAALRGLSYVWVWGHGYTLHYFKHVLYALTIAPTLKIIRLQFPFFTPCGSMIVPSQF
jgi:hypothetical protein